MKHPKPPVAITPETLDGLVRKNTAFPSMDAMLNAQGGYRFSSRASSQVNLMTWSRTRTTPVR